MDARELIRKARRQVAVNALIDFVMTFAMIFVLVLVSHASLWALLTCGLLLLWNFFFPIQNPSKALRKAPGASESIVERVKHLSEVMGIKPPHVKVYDPGSHFTLKPAERSMLGSRTFGAAVTDDVRVRPTMLIGSYVLDGLHTQEEDAVIAHELTHVATRRLSGAFMRHLSRTIWPVAYFFLPVATLLAPDPNPQRAFGILAFLVALPLNALRNMVLASLSRSEESAADRVAAAVTSPLSMASGLVRISEISKVGREIIIEGAKVKEDEKLIYEKLKGAISEPSSPFSREQLNVKAVSLPADVKRFSTHPSLKQRVDDLLDA